MVNSRSVPVLLLLTLANILISHSIMGGVGAIYNSENTTLIRIWRKSNSSYY